MGLKANCDDCKKLVNRKCLFKRKGKFVCGHCKNKGRVVIYQTDVKKIPKHVVLGQYWKKPKKERPGKEKTIVPMIPGAKRPRRFKGSPYFHLYLTKDEKYVLYKKYVANGLTEYQARERLSNGMKYLNDLVIKMKNKGVDEKEINMKFKEEFAKLVEKK